MQHTCTITRGEQGLILLGLERLIDHYDLLIMTEKVTHVVERYKIQQDKALDLYGKLINQEVTDIKVVEYKD